MLKCNFEEVAHRGGRFVYQATIRQDEQILFQCHAPENIALELSKSFIESYVNTTSATTENN